MRRLDKPLFYHDKFDSPTKSKTKSNDQQAQRSAKSNYIRILVDSAISKLD